MFKFRLRNNNRATITTSASNHWKYSELVSHINDNLSSFLFVWAWNPKGATCKCRKAGL